ncbi:MAG: hypothetical protein LKM37_01175 [Bacteroidales bacterium]|jgi:hypothetical protein|nr:hypothetical protein [Bacteroidales bacterium]MCI1733168.1 hypothetical protein [Bacteroidales bacterium]
MRLIEILKNLKPVKENSGEIETDEILYEENIGVEYPPCSIVMGKAETLNNLSAVLDNVMEEKQLYLDQHTSLTKIAVLIGSNRTYLSKILAERGGFYSYINTLRIRHLFRLLSECESAKSLYEDYESNLSERPHRTYGKELQGMLVESGFSDLRSLRRALDTSPSNDDYSKKVRDILFT